MRLKSCTSAKDAARSPIARRQFLVGLSALPLAYGLRATTVEGAEGVGAPASPVAPGVEVGTADMIIREMEPRNAEFPFSLQTDFITPNERFYVRNHFKAAELMADKWRLKIDGAVEKPFEIDLEQLSKMPSKSATVTLECAGNGRVFLNPKVDGAQWQFGAASTAEWTGVPLADLLERAGVKSTAVEVILEGADSGTTSKPSKPDGPFHYARSIPISRALKPGEILIAYRMNGQPLPQAHGFPVRAVVPGWYGMASVKWITRVVVVDERFQGYFQSVDYAYWKKTEGLPPVRIPVTEMQVKSQIARPAMGEIIAAGSPYRVRGAAWTGDSIISKVEVSSDGGKTFDAAKLIGEPKEHAWRLWEWMWEVPPGPRKYSLVARATDARGNSQPIDRDKDLETYMIHHLIPTEVEAK